MAYIRFGTEGSEVYVFPHVGGWYECCGCGMNPGSFRCDTVAEMIGHLEEHRAAGYVVPEGAFQRLREEMS